MNKLLNRWNKSNYILKILCIISAYIIIRIIFMFMYSSKTENFGNPASCTYYYMNNCGHCKRFSPEWDDFVQSYNGPVRLKKIEMNDAGSDLEKYNIQGFPTILFLDEEGNSKFYEGPRTSDGLNKFISDNLN